MTSKDTKPELISTLPKSKIIIDDISGGPWVITHKGMVRYSEMLENRESKFKVSNFKMTIEN
ncbi:MAG: hypothetical protein V4501_11180 [Pseudomonadota bacterium]